MEKIRLQDKYPVFVAEIGKHETSHRTIDALAEYFKNRISGNPKAHFIGVFDHYAHTSRIGGDIVPGLTAAVEVIFCFGFAIPDPRVLAVRPRAIGIADMGDRFVVSFMEAPMQLANETMEAWVLALRDD